MTISELIRYLFYFSIFLWLIPPIRQFKKHYFYFFLILALMDPISLLYFEIVKKSMPLGFYLFANYFLLLSTFEKDSLLRNLYLILISGVVLLGMLIFAGFTLKQIYIILIAIQFLIFATTLKKFIVKYAFEKKFDLFLLVLNFYLITIITKFFNLLVGFADATAFFLITSIAQIIFGFFFSIVRENNS